MIIHCQIYVDWNDAGDVDNRRNEMMNDLAIKCVVEDLLE